MKRLIPIAVIALGAAIWIGYTTAQEKSEIAGSNDAFLQQKKDVTTDPYQAWLDKKTAKKRAGQSKADMPELHGVIRKELRTREGDEAPMYRPNQIMEEYIKAKNRARSKPSVRTENLNFVERGPGNVAGRTRALIADPDDPDQLTFYAGSASGGIWKTTDKGASWEYISSDIPNLGTNTLAMAPSNTDVIYAGTGEHFTSDIDGSGMFKTIDRGLSWTQIADPSVYPDFKNVSRIVVDPNDENVVIATTSDTRWDAGLEAAIYKTTDGGDTWTRLKSSTSQRYDDIDYDPSDFSTLYVAVAGSGVIKSTDGGATWNDASTGMSPEGRVEIAVSPANTNRIWASVQGSLSGVGSDLYVSDDGGSSWLLVVNDGGENEDFLGGQGWYDNIITAHPYDASKVYVGGVNTFLFELTGGDAEAIRVIRPLENGSDAFMNFINFGGGFLGGGMELGAVPEEDLLPVEIRFGQGTQLAHRFTVGGQGPGVPANEYEYQDYVEVPFQVWDTQNNVQLMASFRDQQEDGAWNLIEALTDGPTENHSREYLFIHNLPYADTAADTIAKNGGHEIGEMYFFWPVLASGATFDPAGLPSSNLAITFEITQGTIRETSIVSDAYGQFDGTNAFPQSTRTSGLHPDQHNILVYDKDDASQTFRLLIGNDGGVYSSVKTTLPGPNEGDFDYISYGYNTTQFYGADKAPGQDRYIGGMQDNGTWYHAAGVDGAADANSTFGIGGDGFESLWHSADPNKIIGGSQFNNFRRTLTGGSSWQNATSGAPTGSGTGPFITRLAHHKSVPDRLFTVGSAGVFRSDDFGGIWRSATMNNSDLWSFSNSLDVEVSYANPDVIWAGARMTDNARLHVSTDGGDSFAATENYDVFNMGGVSGIGTHPSDDNTAYALFSFAGYPKVLKTTDMGQTWEDISGFDGTGAESSRGFPDVAVNCLFVFPGNETRIWIGSEIGIVESLDGGASWNLLQSSLPPVNVYDFKLTEDQLIIATYGRGIWSLTLDGIVVAPVVESVAVTPAGSLNFTINFAQSFDSVQVVLGNELLGTIYNTGAGSVTEVLQNQGLNGNQTVTLDAYLGGLKYSSLEKTVFVFQPNDASTSYGTNFFGAVSDFIGFGFRIQNAGFGSPALHSSHPYEDNTENIFYLKTPITVAGSNANFSYEDIAIVEPGEVGTVFGDDRFWDYVVVEATTDGVTWVPLEDGYDATLHNEWLDAYNAGQDATEDLFKEHNIDLLDRFNEGDVILIRFRLYADAGVNAYGWVIENLYIQEQPLSAEEKALSDVVIFPNPVAESATILFKGETPSFVEIIDMNGRTIKALKPLKGSDRVVWSRGNALGGIYIARFELDGQVISKKILIQ